MENDALHGDKFRKFLGAAFENAKRSMKPGACFYIWYASRTGEIFKEAADTKLGEVREQLIWVKNAFVLGSSDYQWQHEPCMYGWTDGAPHYFSAGRDESTVYEQFENINKMTGAEAKRILKEILNGDTETTVLRENKPMSSAAHPTMKPVRLIARLIRNSSKKGDAVLDLFGGSGSTLIACEQLGRQALLMEYDPRFVDVIIKRWEKFTGKKAEKIKGDEKNV